MINISRLFDNLSRSIGLIPSPDGITNTYIPTFDDQGVTLTATVGEHYKDAFPKAFATSLFVSAPKVKSVIFNPPATIVYWKDGTKTVVKCHDDSFSEEFGFAMAVIRKIYGSRKNFFNQFKNAQRPYKNPKKAKRSIEGSTDVSK